MPKDFSEEELELLRKAVSACAEQFDSGSLYITSTCGFCGKRTDWDSINIEDGEPRISKHKASCVRNLLLERLSNENL